jgi:O-antigen/teichoic acid export membrane protein
MLVIPMLIIGPLAPDLFRVAFGPEWERAGVIVIMMLPWYAFRLIASPISMVMHVRMRQRLMLMLTLAGLAGRVLPLLAVLYFAPEQATLVFAITSALFYFSIVVVFMTIAGVTVAALTRLVATELALWGGSVTAAFIVLRVIEYA